MSERLDVVAARGGPSGVLTELARPAHFEAVAKGIGPTSLGDQVVCATDAGPVVEAIDRFIAAGFDTVDVHQVGPDQQRLIDLIRSDLLPHYR